MEKLNFEHKKQLVDALMKCDTISNSLSDVINELSDNIRETYKSADTLQNRVLNIVNRCLEYPDKIEELITIVGSFERNSYSMQKVCEAIFRILSPDEPPISYKKVGQLLAILLQNPIYEDELTDCYLGSLFDDCNPINQKDSLFSILIHLTSIPKQRGIWPILIFAKRFYEKTDDEQIKILLKNWIAGIDHKLDKVDIKTIQSEADPPRKPNSDIKADLPEVKFRSQLSGHANYITSIAWSPDRLLLASGSADRTIRIWDVENGKQVQIIEEQPDTILSLAWSPDGKMLAVSCENNHIRFWDTKTWLIRHSSEPGQKNFQNLAWSPDSKRLASGNNDGTIGIWDAVSGKLVRILKGHRGMVYSVVWSSDGQYVASGSADETVRVWKPDHSRAVNILKGHRDIVLSVDWASEGNILASGSRDNTIRIWNPASGRQRAIIEGHTHGIQAVSFSKDGQILASGSFDNTIILWRCDTWTQINSNQVANPYPLAFHPEFAILASLEGIRHINVYELSDNNILSFWPDLYNSLCKCQSCVAGR